jgi:hypothetical protein
MFRCGLSRDGWIKFEAGAPLTAVPVGWTRRRLDGKAEAPTTPWVARRSIDPIAGDLRLSWKIWWSQAGSNRRPLECHDDTADAMQEELPKALQ